MRHVLSPESLRALRRFVGPDTLLAFDFDGTLAPIVDQPQHAGMRPATRLLLRRLALLRTCAVLSGRSLSDLRKKLHGTGIRHLVGNHGAEPSRDASAIRAQVRDWDRLLRLELPGLESLWIENKSLSLTVHYRRCARKRKARTAIVEAAVRLQNVRCIEGKESVSFVSQFAPHKGHALKAIAASLGFRRALYVGDDRTDEDAFRIDAKALPVFSILVGRRRGSAASYFLEQGEIDQLLRQLLSSCRHPPG